MRDTHEYQEREISSRIKERKFWEIEVVWFRRLPTRSSTLQEVGILPTLVYFPSLLWETRVFHVRACLAKKKWDF